MANIVISSVDETVRNILLNGENADDTQVLDYLRKFDDNHKLKTNIPRSVILTKFVSAKLYNKHEIETANDLHYNILKNISRDIWYSGITHCEISHLTNLAIRHFIRTTKRCARLIVEKVNTTKGTAGNFDDNQLTHIFNYNGIRRNYYRRQLPDNPLSNISLISSSGKYMYPLALATAGGAGSKFLGGFDNYVTPLTAMLFGTAIGSIIYYIQQPLYYYAKYDYPFDHNVISCQLVAENVTADNVQDLVEKNSATTSKIFVHEDSNLYKITDDKIKSINSIISEKNNHQLPLFCMINSKDKTILDIYFIHDETKPVAAIRIPLDCPNNLGIISYSPSSNTPPHDKNSETSYTLYANYDGTIQLVHYLPDKNVWEIVTTAKTLTDNSDFKIPSEYERSIYYRYLRRYYFGEERGSASLYCGILFLVLALYMQFKR
ncbi:hypothetical protein [Trichoplusia ni ascovirus 6b]|nr:hypothetical protein [Trichoplusia ni ascovirus 6b]